MKDELDLLGGQLVLALQFMEAGFDTSKVLQDGVRSAELPAGDIFEKRGPRWFMRNDSLPGDLTVKAIGVDDGGVYLETALPDTEEVAEVIVKQMLPLAYRGGQIVDTTTDRVLATVTYGPRRGDKRARSDKEFDRLAPRCLWTIPRTDDPIRKTAAIRLADAIYSAGAFELEGLEDEAVSAGPVTSVAMVQRMSMEMGLHLQQRLAIEQRPLLALEMAPRLEQRLEIRQLLALEHRILHMRPDQILEYVAKDASPEGLRRALHVFHFVLAGQIKRGLKERDGRDISWKDARRLARQVTSTGTRPTRTMPDRRRR